MGMKKYDHTKIEKKWQKEWDKEKLYKVEDSVTGKENFYQLVEFTYPSGNLHVGHWYAFAVPDIFARYKRMQGFNVLYPMGFDAFGLPAENAAIKENADPKVWTYEKMNAMRIQLKSMGAIFDWDREIVSCDPQYYKWTQWMFNKFLEHDLVYRDITKVNWCPKDQTILANEQVVDGHCERCGAEVEQRNQEQWMLRITKYADRLIDDLDALNWPEEIKAAQKNWIGRSEGSEIEFHIRQSPSPTLPKGKGEIPGYMTSNDEIYETVQERAVEMRKAPTKAEEILWDSLRGNKIGYHIRRQHVIDRFVVDFACLKENLVIEIDGDIHDLQKEKDEERTNILKNLGFRVIRFKNDEVIKNLDGVINKILNELKNPSLGEGQGWASSEIIKVFTTRADTLFGVTYIVLAPEHELVESLKSKVESEENRKQIEKYISDTKKKSELDRKQQKEKTGVELKGVKAVNPANGEEVPIWVADYVLAGYGTGAIMAVPAHDERDFEFAKKYNLPIKRVVEQKFIATDSPMHSELEIPATYRNAICAIIRNPKDDTYLCSVWKDIHCHGLITGGVEEDEDIVEGALREIYEETGYKNLKFIRNPDIAIHTFFYHRKKEVNRWARFQYLFFDLIDEVQDSIDENEFAIHDVVWKSKDELNDFFSVVEGEFSLTLIENNGDYVYTGEGILGNSGRFNGMDSEEARTKITEAVGGKMVKTYRLRDWGISRQRYWGTPIPIVYDPQGKAHPVPDEHLPWILPDDVDHKPSGVAPLAKSKELFMRTEKIFGEGWKPEVETMDTFVDSSWYFYRYLDNKNSKTFADKKHRDAWMPIDLYMGGAEHTTMHLLYSRFWVKAMHDLEMVKEIESYKVRRNRGLILGPDGNKMSKSKGNVVNPDEIVERLGADTVRMYLAFMGPYGVTVNYPWDPNGVVGVRRFLERVWKLKDKLKENKEGTSFFIEKSTHLAIKNITEYMESYKFNTAVSQMMILLNYLEKQDVTIEIYKTLLQLLSPFAPHMTEELWRDLGEKKSIHLTPWPTWDKDKIIDTVFKIVVQVNGKVRTQFEVESSMSEEDIKIKVLADQAIRSWTEGKEIKRVIYVKDRLVNIVV